MCWNPVIKIWQLCWFHFASSYSPALKKESSGTMEGELHMQSSKGLFCSGGLICKSEVIRISSLLPLFVLEVSRSKHSLGYCYLQLTVSLSAKATLEWLHFFCFLGCKWWQICCILWCGVVIVNTEYVRWGNATLLKVCLQHSHYNNRWSPTKLPRRHMPRDCQKQHSAAVKHSTLSFNLLHGRFLNKTQEHTEIKYGSD